MRNYKSQFTIYTQITNPKLKNGREYLFAVIVISVLFVICKLQIVY
jgi:hypothetical protein